MTSETAKPDTKRRPVVVVRVGRSGTSTVARLLQEELGISMGRKFDPPNRACPEGSYEDLEFRELGMRFAAGKIGLPTFRTAVERLAEERDRDGGAWGFKDPRCCSFLGLYLTWLDPVVIWCRRDLEDVVRSWERVTTAVHAEAWFEVQARHRHLVRLLGEPGCWERCRLDVLRIDFTHPVPDDELVERIGPFISWSLTLETGES